ncbi:MAG: hypothetical protein P8Y45_19485 [Exilibacterium sp.]
MRTYITRLRTPLLGITIFASLASANGEIRCGIEEPVAGWNSNGDTIFEVPNDGPAVLGKTISEWSAIWWQWALGIKVSNNPMLDKTGHFCDEGQQGPVWFLAGVWGGGSAERTCTVPSGMHIFFPIANNIWVDTAMDMAGTEETDCRIYATAFPSSVSGELEATLDGNPIIFDPETPMIWSQSPAFSATYPQQHVFNIFADRKPFDPDDFTGYPTFSDGFWIILPPLEAGEHELHFGAGEAQDVTYHLTVE